VFGGTRGALYARCGTQDAWHGAGAGLRRVLTIIDDVSDVSSHYYVSTAWIQNVFGIFFSNDSAISIL